MEYFTAEKVSEHVTAIRSYTDELMYLVEGNDAALLIDTNVGVKGLRELVENLTDKPITVVLSHGHIDHAMGAPEFEEVYMSPLDIPLYQSMCALEERKNYVKFNTQLEMDNDFFVETKEDMPFLELKDEMVFKLGGVSVTAYAFPGHTPGTFVFLVKPDRILILGDACNNSTFLFDEFASSVKDYKREVKRIDELLDGEFDRVFIMHHVLDAPISILKEMLEVCDDVIAGNTDDLPFNFRGYEALIAKDTNEFMQRGDGKFANLIYNPDHID